MKSIRFALLSSFVVFSIGFNQAAESGGFPCLGTVTGDRVSVRPGPSKNHVAFTHFSRGTRLVTEALQGEWYEVRLPADRTCWIGADYLTASGDDAAQVTGNQVRVRVTPGTKQSPIGFVSRGQSVRTTGRKDPAGQWVECFAPAGTKVFVHRDFLELGKPLAGAEVDEIVRTPGTAPPSPAERMERAQPKETKAQDAPQPAGAASQTGPELSLDSARLRAIYERYRVEHAKLAEGNYKDIRRELETLRDNSEDVTESTQAEQLLTQVTADLELQSKYAEIKQRERAARERIAEGEEKEQDIARAVHRIPPDSATQEFLAAGWVVSLGKHSKVDGTHKLMKGNKVLYFLRSEQFLLDNYVNRHIGIRGIVRELPDEFEAHLIDVTEIEVLSK